MPKSGVEPMSRRHFDNIPPELRRLHQWVVVRNKVPYDPKTLHGRAKVNDASTWASFDRATMTFRSGRFDGIAFVFTKDDDFVGIDLDACRNPETGELTTWASEILALFPRCYTETSPGKSGLHIIV